MSEYALICEKLANLLRGNFDPIEGEAEHDTQAVRDLIRLSAMLRETVRFSAGLASGDLSAAPPGRGNTLAGGIKSLHSQLLHVSWQAEQIAMGDYSQKLDFMGDFSRNFNRMTDQVAKRESEQRAYREMMMGVFDSLPSAIFLLDPDTRAVVYINRPAAELFGAAPGSRIDDLSLPALRHLVDSHTPGFEAREYCDPESRRWSLVHVDALCWAEDAMIWLYNCVDITDDKYERDKLSKEAQTDMLTGVLNRFGGSALLERLLSHIKGGERFCLCYMDLDGLKQVNDTYGHAEGDRLIVRFANGLTGTLRENDFVVRMGGDEFLAIFQHQSRRAVDRAMERLTRRFDAENDGRVIPVRFSYGALEVVAPTLLTVDQMIKQVDQIMYLQKREKKKPLPAPLVERRSAEERESV